jgi:hypothetical protein
MERVFDRVVLQTANSPVSLTVAEFFALPLNQRLRAIFEKRVDFYKGAERVELVHALRAIREGGVII